MRFNIEKSWGPGPGRGRKGLRKLSEIADTLGVPWLTIVSRMAHDPQHPKPAMIGGNVRSGNAYYVAAEVVEWWKTHNAKAQRTL